MQSSISRGAVRHRLACVTAVVVLLPVAGADAAPPTRAVSSKNVLAPLPTSPTPLARLTRSSRAIPRHHKRAAGRKASLSAELRTKRRAPEPASPALVRGAWTRGPATQLEAARVRRLLAAKSEARRELIAALESVVRRHGTLARARTPWIILPRVNKTPSRHKTTPTHRLHAPLQEPRRPPASVEKW